MHRQRGPHTIFFDMGRPAIVGDQFDARAEALDRRRYGSGATHDKRKDVGNRSCSRSGRNSEHVGRPRR
jgi:hypothetical protein